MLNDGQKALTAVMTHVQRNPIDKRSGYTARQMAEMVGVSVGTIHVARRIVCFPDLIDGVLDGAIALNEAASESKGRQCERDDCPRFHGNAPKRTPPESEKAIQDRVIDYAEERGYAVVHMSPRYGRGFPDLAMYRGNRVIFVEMKTDTGATSDEQVAWGNALARDNEYYVWRPSDWEEIKRILR